jgi:hypothetical protein
MIIIILNLFAFFIPPREILFLNIGLCGVIRSGCLFLSDINKQKLFEGEEFYFRRRPKIFPEMYIKINY